MARTHLIHPYPEFPEEIEGVISPVQETIAPSPQETAYWSSMVKRLAASTAISPNTASPMGYSLYFLISSTRREDASTLDTDELYRRFRAFVPDAARIANVAPAQFKEHLRRWAAFNGTPYLGDADGQPSALCGYALRDEPLDPGMAGAFVEGLAMGCR